MTIALYVHNRGGMVGDFDCDRNHHGYTPEGKPATIRLVLNQSPGTRKLIDAACTSHPHPMCKYIPKRRLIS